jgi:Ser/Thr protein kinase RdoA (MazF antagonist)
MANRSLRVVLSTGEQYVIKILVHQKPELFANELAIQQYLHEGGIAAPRFLRAPTGEYIFQPAGFHGFAAVVSPALPGVHPSGLTKPLAYAMGGMLANYHAAVRSLPAAHAGWLNRETTRTATADSKDSALKDAALDLVAEAAPMFAAHLPVGIIHGDFHCGNLLVRSRTSSTIVAVLDFEEAEKNLLLVDIAFGLFGSHSLATNARHTGAILHSFLDGYETVRPLQQAEGANLAAAVCYVAGACTLWMHARGHEANAIHNLRVARALRKIDLRR